ncbi:MAG: site-specific integrase, partial [Balneolaceae bacterium]
MAFKQELDLYLQFVKLEKGLSENSVISYKNDLERYFLFLASEKKMTDLGGVTLSHIEDFLNFLVDEELLSSSSLARNISSIRGFHEFAVVEGITKANPAELVELPKKASKLPEVL